MKKRAKNNRNFRKILSKKKKFQKRLILKKIKKNKNYKKEEKLNPYIWNIDDNESLIENYYLFHEEETTTDLDYEEYEKLIFKPI